MALAENCCVAPTRMDALAGETVTDATVTVLPASAPVPGSTGPSPPQAVSSASARIRWGRRVLMTIQEKSRYVSELYEKVDPTLPDSNRLVGYPASSSGNNSPAGPSSVTSARPVSGVRSRFTSTNVPPFCRVASGTEAAG